MALFWKKKKEEELPLLPSEPAIPKQKPEEALAALEKKEREQLKVPSPPLPPLEEEKESELKLTIEEIEKISSALIEEKWKKFHMELEKLEEWKAKIDAELDELKRKTDKLDSKVDELFKSVLGKVEEYSKGIKDVGVEIKALQKAFSDILPQFIEGVHELQEIVKKKKR